MIRIIEANTHELITQAKSLFLEYTETLDFSLCFQNFDNELENFTSQYSPPAGNLFLALFENDPIGCVGVRYFEKDICEMKRLYIRSEFRGKGTGKKLAVSAIESGKALGYDYMRLDTLSSMETANQLYKSLGFVEIDPYRDNPIRGAIYMEMKLNINKCINKSA
jgi:ribosomal protein S18 acetylase RimI-like enzyme